MLQTKFMLIKSDQTKPQSPTRRVTYVVGHDSRIYIVAGGDQDVHRGPGGAQRQDPDDQLRGLQVGRTLNKERIICFVSLGQAMVRMKPPPPQAEFPAPPSSLGSSGPLKHPFSR